MPAGERERERGGVEGGGLCVCVCGGGGADEKQGAMFQNHAYADMSCCTLSGRYFDSLRARLFMLLEMRRRLALPFFVPRAPAWRDEDLMSKRTFRSYFFSSLPRRDWSLDMRVRCLSSQSTVAPLPCIRVVSLHVGGSFTGKRSMRGRFGVRKQRPGTHETHHLTRYTPAQNPYLPSDSQVHPLERALLSLNVRKGVYFIALVENNLKVSCGHVKVDFDVTSGYRRGFGEETVRRCAFLSTLP